MIDPRKWCVRAVAYGVLTSALAVAPTGCSDDKKVDPAAIEANKTKAKEIQQEEEAALARAKGAKTKKGATPEGRNLKGRVLQGGGAPAPE